MFVQLQYYSRPPSQPLLFFIVIKTDGWMVIKHKETDLIYEKYTIANIVEEYKGSRKSQLMNRDDERHAYYNRYNCCEKCEIKTRLVARIT